MFRTRNGMNGGGGQTLIEVRCLSRVGGRFKESGGSSNGHRDSSVRRVAISLKSVLRMVVVIAGSSNTSSSGTRSSGSSRTNRKSWSRGGSSSSGSSG
eukprot:4948694-Pyramimonas_sp.AAC.1